MKILPLFILVTLLSGCTKQSDHTPRFSIGEAVEFNNICPNDDCNFHGTAPTEIMPMYILSGSNANGYQGHIEYECYDSKKPIADTIYVIDFDLEKYKVGNKQ
jgi:hypothetical protein